VVMAGGAPRPFIGPGGGERPGEAEKWLAVTALMPFNTSWLNEGSKGGLMVGGSNGTGAASRGAEWWWRGQARAELEESDDR
jgi:hypothetical protein